MKQSTRSYYLTELGEAQNDLRKVEFLLQECKGEKDIHILTGQKVALEERIIDLKELLNIKADT